MSSSMSFPYGDVHDFSECLFPQSNLFTPRSPRSFTLPLPSLVLFIVVTHSTHHLLDRSPCRNRHRSDLTTGLNATHGSRRQQARAPTSRSWHIPTAVAQPTAVVCARRTCVRGGSRAVDLRAHGHTDFQRTHLAEMDITQPHVRLHLCARQQPTCAVCI